jgi:hypothetical protein
MFKRMEDSDDGNTLPSWLKDNEGAKKSSKAEKTPLLKGTMGNTSYGGSSKGPSAHSGVEENYGDEEPNWVRETKVRFVDDEGSDENDSEEEESSEEEDSSEASDEEIVTEYDDNWNKQSQKREVVDPEAPSESSRIPRRNCCHSIFIFVQIIASLANLCMILVQVIPIIACQLIPLQEVVRVYMSVFCFFNLLTELELVKGASNWMVRGIFYTFIGVVTLEQREAMIATGLVHKPSPSDYWKTMWASLIIEIASWWVIASGCLYFILGLFCMKGIRDRVRDQYQDRLKEWDKEKA